MSDHITLDHVDQYPQLGREYNRSAKSGHCRASVVNLRIGDDTTLRAINNRIRLQDEVVLPLDHIVPTNRNQDGLVLVTGSVGSGKSTALAARFNFINSNCGGQFLTIEDPIGYVFEYKCCHDIREGKTFMLPGVMQTDKNVGTITLDAPPVRSPADENKLPTYRYQHRKVNISGSKKSIKLVPRNKRSPITQRGVLNLPSSVICRKTPYRHPRLHPQRQKLVA